MHRLIWFVVIPVVFFPIAQADSADTATKEDVEDVERKLDKDKRDILDELDDEIDSVKDDIDKAVSKVEKQVESDIERVEEAYEELQEAREDDKEAAGRRLSEVEQRVDDAFAALEKRLAKIRKSEAINFGLSLGWRRPFNFPKGREIAHVDPVDSLLAFEAGDKGEILLSTVVTSFVWAGKGEKAGEEHWNKGFRKHLKNLGIMTNLNLTDLGSEQASGIFNKNVDGGFGLVYKLHEDVAIGVTYEKFTVRRALEALTTRDGEKLPFAIDADDNNQFRDDGVNAYSFKIVYNIFQLL